MTVVCILKLSVSMAGKQIFHPHLIETRTKIWDRYYIQLASLPPGIGNSTYAGSPPAVGTKSQASSL